MILSLWTTQKSCIASASSSSEMGIGISEASTGPSDGGSGIRLSAGVDGWIPRDSNSDGTLGSESGWITQGSVPLFVFPVLCRLGVFSSGAGMSVPSGIPTISSYWNTPGPLMLGISTLCCCSMLGRWVLISRSDSSLTCSGATLYTLLTCEIHTTDVDSWMMTWAGPNHCPGASPRPGLQNMTNAPGWWLPLCGRCLLSVALRILSWLSISINAFRAFSRFSSCCRNARPSGDSCSAKYCAASGSSAVFDAGRGWLFPKTRISGVYPRWRAREFLALQHCSRRSENSWLDEMGLSPSHRFNICWSISPCLSVFPFCQCAYAAAGRMWIFRSCVNLLNLSEHNALSLSVISCLHAPAQCNHARLNASNSPSASVWCTSIAWWKLVAMSMKCTNVNTRPALDVQETKSHPTQSLNLRVSGSVAGRAVFGRLFSKHELQWKSSRASITSDEYPWSFSTLASLCLFGWPKLVCIFFNHCCFSFGRLRNFGPWVWYGMVCSSSIPPFSVVPSGNLSEVSWSMVSGLCRLEDGVSPSLRVGGSWPIRLSLCSTLVTSVLILPNIVTNIRIGGLLVVIWRILFCSQFSHWLLSKTSPSRCMPNAYLCGASPLTSFTGDLRNLSTPLAISMTLRLVLEKNSCILSNTSPPSRTTFPTFGAISEHFVMMSFRVCSLGWFWAGSSLVAGGDTDASE